MVQADANRAAADLVKTARQHVFIVYVAGVHEGRFGKVLPEYSTLAARPQPGVDPPAQPLRQRCPCGECRRQQGFDALPDRLAEDRRGAAG